MPGLSRHPAGQGGSNSGSEDAAQRGQSLAEAPAALGAAVPPCDTRAMFLFGTACICHEGTVRWELGMLRAGGPYVCLPPFPSTRQELAMGQWVPFAGEKAKWHWICFCSPLCVTWCRERSRQLRALPGWVGCAALPHATRRPVECGVTGTRVVCVALGEEVDTCWLSPHPPVLLQAVCVLE